MNETKNDASADEVKLDFEALLETARIAVGLTQQRIVEYSIGLQDEVESSVKLYLNAQCLAQEARSLVVATETLYALSNARSRTKLTIINREVGPLPKDV